MFAVNKIAAIPHDAGVRKSIRTKREKGKQMAKAAAKVKTAAKKKTPAKKPAAKKRTTK